MPLFRLNSEVHVFTHVPKCGDTSIEAYLEERFGTLALLRNEHDFAAGHNRSRARRWGWSHKKQLYRTLSSRQARQA
jgi:hypothetical protein